MQIKLHEQTKNNEETIRKCAESWWHSQESWNSIFSLIASYLIQQLNN